MERLKDHINMHFISQMKRPMPSAAAAAAANASTFAQTPRSASNGSASTNGSHHDDVIGTPPEPKRIKLERPGASPEQDVSDNEDSGSHGALEGPRRTQARCSTSPPCPPLALRPNLSPKLPDLDLRCHSCDIGFSHLSNLTAHKKFYCRGMKSAGAVDVKTNN